MSFLGQNYIKLGNGEKELSIKNNKIYDFYDMWKELLFERCMRLFIWDGVDFPSKEIEQNLLIFGFACITRNKYGMLVCARGTFYQQKVFYDEYKYCTYNLPYETGKREIDKDCIIIDNTKIRNSLYPLIHHYALLLAHVDVSLQSELVNLRSGKTAIAKNPAVAESVNEWYKKLYEGETMVIKDDFLSSVAIESTTHANNNLINLMELRKELLNSFYNDIGIRTSSEKRERMNIPEVSLDLGVLLVNIDDMLDCRKTACEKVNEMFGMNWTVRKSIEYETLDKQANDIMEGVSENEN